MAIIGVLVALTLTGVQSARVAARTTLSKSNLHQLALAEDMASEGREINLIGWREAGIEKNRNVWRSPNDPTSSQAWPTAVSYCENDFLGYRYLRNGAVRETVEDGKANTILYTEHYSICGRFAFLPDGSNTPITSPPNDQPRIALFASAIWNDVVPITDQRVTYPSVRNKKFQVMPKEADCDASIPQTLQRGGLLVAMHDASVRIVHPQVDVQVFWSAVTPRGGEAPPPW